MKLLLFAVVCCASVALFAVRAADYKPTSVSCQKFQSAVSYSLVKCHKNYYGVLWAQLCDYHCDRSGQITLTDCHKHYDKFKDYPECDDLYCRDLSDPANKPPPSKRPISKPPADAGVTPASTSTSPVSPDAEEG